MISCATSIELGLIQPHRCLDVVPEKGSLICSKADLSVKQKNEKNSRDQQSHTVSRVQQNEVIQCMEEKVETKSKQQKCQAPSPTVFKKRTVKLEKVLICSQRSPKWICSQMDQQC